MTFAAACALSDDGRELLVLQLAGVQAVLDQRGVVPPVGLCDLLGLLQRLTLPVGVAPLVLADRQRRGSAARARGRRAATPGTRRLPFRTPPAARRRTRAPATGQLLRLLQQEHEAIRTRQVAAFVGARPVAPIRTELWCLAAAAGVLLPSTACRRCGRPLRSRYAFRQ